MSLEHEKEIDPEAKVHEEQESSEGPVAEAGSGPVDDPQENPKEGPDLEGKALAAAEVAISEGESTIRDLPDDLRPDGPGTTQRGPSSRDWVLRTMLFFNLILMGVMLLLPAPTKTSQPSSPTSPNTPPTQGHPEIPPVEPPLVTVDSQPGREQPGSGGNGIASNEIWSEAFMFLGEDRYDDAAESLLEYERSNPQMLEGQRLNLYTLLSTCLFKAGRMEEAEEYRAKANNLVHRGYLPEDLRDAARKAWSEGRSGEARRYFARFLLQQKQLSPTLRQSVPEAYLRIGDSYRKEADAGTGEGKR